MNPSHRPLLRLFATSLVILLSLVPKTGASDREPVVVSIGDEARVWEGWGTSLAWWAKVFGQREDVADWLFTLKTVHVDGHEVPGLGMTIARYNAGASSWVEVDGRRMAVSRIIRPYRQLESFWLDGRDPNPESASWDWGVDANQRSMLQKAHARGADRFELFSNSPPWWMCLNDNPSGAENPSVENLSPTHHENFAHYLATIARHAKDNWGITFTTVAPFNEPSAPYWFADCKQEGSFFTRESQAAIFPLVRSALDKAGLQGIELSSSDESFVEQAIATWKSLPADVRSIIPQVNVHGYQGPRSPRAELHQLVVEEGGKRLWNSEYGDRFGDGLHLARNLHYDFHRLKPTAWCYWQPLDGGANGGWGMMNADLLAARILEPNPKLHMFAQYSRHIRPGMLVLETDNAYSIVARDPVARRVVIVVFNATDDPELRSFDLSKFVSKGASVSSWTTEPRGTARYTRLPDTRLASTTKVLSLSPRSVLTVEIQDAPVTP